MKMFIILFTVLSTTAQSTKLSVPLQQSIESFKLENDDHRISDYKIDRKYFAGNYLIYDCEDHHFACVDAMGYSDCGDNRERALNKKSNPLPCAPLKIFLDKRSCIENSYKYVNSNALKSFCFLK